MRRLPMSAWAATVAMVFVPLFACASEPSSNVPPGTRLQVDRPASMTSLDHIAGWRDLLTDGLDGWQGTRSGDSDIGPGWSFADGVVHLSAGGQGGDLVSPAPYEDFELVFEWRVGPGANSGVKVRVPAAPPGQPRIGPEYQVLDDVGHPDGQDPKTSAGALYGLAAPVDKTVAPAGVFRRGRIVARGDRLEHWLDGQRIVDVSLGSAEFESARASSKFAGLPDFGRGAGHVVLQDHGDEVWFRRVFIRDLLALPGEPVVLDLGPELRGWSRVGDARYTGDGSTIVGEVTGGRQSFLITDLRFGDFLMEVDVKMDVAANSGIQVRSTVDDDTGVLSGYQIEIDHSPRAWSGGLYDEMRRGWLDDLSEDPLARAAFDLGGWNHYRIECIGPSIRASVNGVPTANHLDAMTLRGVIGLQVHNGSVGRFRWRDLRVRDLGGHRWDAAPLEPSGPTTAPDPRAAGGAAWSARVPGTWTFPLAQDAGDLSVRVRYVGDGELTVRRGRSEGASVPVAGGAAHVLEVHAYGDRLAVVQDGRTLADLSDAFGASRGPCVLEARLQPGQVLEITGIERLVREGPSRKR